MNVMAGMISPEMNCAPKLDPVHRIQELLRTGEGTDSMSSAKQGV
jgi:hypothetical protein